MKFVDVNLRVETPGSEYMEAVKMMDALDVLVCARRGFASARVVYTSGTGGENASPNLLEFFLSFNASVAKVESLGDGYAVSYSDGKMKIEQLKGLCRYSFGAENNR